MHQELIDREQQGLQRGATLAAFSKATIRSLIPIRDTSRWAGKKLPPKWTQMAKEPLTWSTLFAEDALTVKPRQRGVSSLLKSYRYATSNFGAAVATTTVLRVMEQRVELGSTHEADWNAYASVIDDFVIAANEDRVMEFIAEAPEAKRKELRRVWLQLVSTAGTNAENDRDAEKHPPM
jgi:hypothetical protein